MDIQLDAFDPDIFETHTARQSYGHLRAYDRMTGEPKGWLGCTSGGSPNYVRLYMEQDAAAAVKFVEEGSLKYLARSTSPNDRFLGLSSNSYAGWGLLGGSRNAIKYHEDKAISLDPYDDPSFTNRFLYLNGGGLYKDYCRWSEDATNSNILILKLE